MRLDTRRRLILLALTALLLIPFLTPAAAPAATPARSFGVYVDPWHLDPWRDAHIAPQYVARFEAFSRGVAVDGFLRQAEQQQLSSVLISWEPWKPVSPELGVEEQFAAQPGYRNVDIASGAQDEYMLRFARSLATFRGTV